MRRSGIAGPRRRAAAAAWCTALAAWPTASRGDQIVANGANHRDAKVLDLSEGRLHFRTSEGRSESAWVDEIELLVLDRAGVFDDLNQAERFLAAGDAEKAAVRFERAQRLCGDFWPDYAAARLVLAYDRIGQIDKATLGLIRTVRGKFTGPPAAARIIPRSIPVQRDARCSRAIDQLDTALGQNPGDPIRAVLELSRIEYLFRVGDERARRLAPAVALIAIPESAGSERVYTILATTMRQAGEVELRPLLFTALDRAIRDCPEPVLPSFLLLKGDWMLRHGSTPADWIRASWPCLRVAVHFAADPRAGEGMLGAARALAKAGETKYAQTLLAECIANTRAREETRLSAQQLLADLKSGLGKTP